MNHAQHYTPEDLLLSYIFPDYAYKNAKLETETPPAMQETGLPFVKPLTEITVADLKIIRQMPVLPDGIIIYDMKSGEKRSGKLEFTEEMKNNLIRFAKENVKEYMQKQTNDSIQ